MNYYFFLRSCGQIFCADCSEHWAALPEKGLYTPVRLCGPCYIITSKCQVSSYTEVKYGMISKFNDFNFQQNLEQNQNQSIPSYAQCTLSSSENRNAMQHYHTNGTSATSTTSSNSLEPCKHSMSNSKNDQGPTKAATVTN